MSDRMPSVLELVFGYTAAKMIDVAARLRVADHLAEGQLTIHELAERTETHEQSLFRLLRGLACFGVVVQTSPDTFTLGPGGQQLRSDTPESIRSMVMLLCADETWRSWGELEYSVRTGAPAWDQVIGVSNFEFLAKHPEQAAVFNAAMSEYTRAAIPGIIGRHDFTRYATIVDIGGGDGSLLAEILKASPTTRGTVFDLPAGVDGAARTFEAAGVADRATVTPGDFFATGVPAGAEAYLLKSVLHDWGDEKATQLLRTLRDAVAPGGAVLAVEPVLPATVENPAVTGIVMSDINMLVNTGGRERTLDEYRALFTAAGLELADVSGEGTDFCVLEGRVV